MNEDIEIEVSAWYKIVK